MLAGIGDLAYPLVVTLITSQWLRLARSSTVSTSSPKTSPTNFMHDLPDYLYDYFGNLVIPALTLAFAYQAMFTECFAQGGTTKSAAPEWVSATRFIHQCWELFSLLIQILLT
nr:hypothetical protein CFP56_30681 [Quercus suber]